MMQWFRWYAGTIDDGKLRYVARNARVTLRDVIAVWAMLLEEASNPEHRGVCHKNEDYIASVLDFDDGVVEEIFCAMQKVGMIDVEIGAVIISNWKKRQFETDAKDSTNAERQRRWREKRKNVASFDTRDGHETDRNGSVTDSNAPDTDTDTDTDTDKEPPIPPADTGGGGDGFKLEGEPSKPVNGTKARASPGDSPAFREFWAAYPHRGRATDPRKPAAERFHRLVKRGVDPAKIIDGARGYAAACDEMRISGTDKVKQAQSWLNQECWEQYVDKAPINGNKSAAILAMERAMESRDSKTVLEINTLMKEGRHTEADAMGSIYLSRSAH